MAIHTSREQDMTMQEADSLSSHVESSIGDLLDVIESLDNQLEDSKGECGSLQRTVDELEGELAALKEQVLEMEAELVNNRCWRSL